MRRHGVVLAAVLVLVTLAGMVAAGLLFRMRAAVAASKAVGDGEQAYAAAMSGIQRAITVLQTSRGSVESWYDNPDLFRNQLVCDDGTVQWYFTVYAPNPLDPSVVRYGLIDEASKINLNLAISQNQRDTLLSLPNMTDELVDCLMDYGDRDENTRPQGAEQDYYDQLDSPYLVKNGAIATLEELMLVKGFSASLIFGEDYNLNGVLDLNEDDEDESFPPDDSDGQLDMGLRGVLATITYGADLDSNGQPRMNINGKLDGLEEIGLPDETVEFIQLYNAERNNFSHPADLLEMRYRLKNDHGGRKGGEWIVSGVGRAELPLVCDRLTARKGNGFAMGLINVNTASSEVLATLPGIGESTARAIASVRSGLSTETKASIAWLYTQGVLAADEFKAVAPLLEARGYQYRAQVVGFGVPCGRFRVIEAVIDLGRGAPRIVYLRDTTRLGLPCKLSVESLETDTGAG